MLSRFWTSRQKYTICNGHWYPVRILQANLNWEHPNHVKLKSYGNGMGLDAGIYIYFTLNTRLRLLQFSARVALQGDVGVVHGEVAQLDNHLHARVEQMHHLFLLYFCIFRFNYIWALWPRSCQGWSNVNIFLVVYFFILYFCIFYFDHLRIKGIQI